MKKILSVAAILLFALCLLWGCGENADNNEKLDTTVYYFMDRDTTITPDESGVYTLNFHVNGEKKSFKTSDRTIVEALASQDFVGLTLEGDTIVGFTRMLDMPYMHAAQDYFIQSTGGNKIKLSGPENYEFLNLLLEIPEGTPIYDVTPQSTDYSGNAAPRKSDCFSAITDMQGNILAGYITARVAVPHEGKQYCQHCGSEVEWKDWVATNKLPVSSGHYILKDNITLAKTADLSDGNVCMDLNGKTVTQGAIGEILYRVIDSAQLSVMDSVGTGKIIPNSTDGGSADSGMGIYINGSNAIFNLYSGTIDASNCTASFGNAVYMNDGTINIYDGTVLGGNSYGAGGCAVSAKGIMNIYGGKIVGGKLIDATYHLPIGGAALRVLGACNIYGGEIVGGETDTVGGIIRVCGDAFDGAKLVLKGGTLSGGKAPVGGGIYVSSLSQLQIVGDVQIEKNETGTIYLADGAEVTVDTLNMSEKANVSVTFEKGAVIKASEGAELDKYIKTDSGKKLAYLGNETWGVK